MLFFEDILFNSKYYFSESFSKSNSNNSFYESNLVLLWFIINLFVSFLVFKFINMLVSIYFRFHFMEKNIDNLQKTHLFQKIAIDNLTNKLENLNKKYENLINEIYIYEEVNDDNLKRVN